VYRNLTAEEFKVVKNAAAKICTEKDLKTSGDYKRVENELIDEIKAGRLTFSDLVKPKIRYTPKEKEVPADET